MNVEWNLVGAVILSGLVIVFALLIVLIGVVALSGRLVNRVRPKEERREEPAQLLPVVRDDVGEETVAAISAAIAVFLDGESGAQYRISSISRAGTGRPVWGFAGMQQNTRPF